MTNLRFLFRSFISPWIVFIAGVISQQINLNVGEQPWAGEYLLSAEWHVTSLYLWMPPVAAAVAFDYGRQFSYRSSSMLSHRSFRKPSAMRLLVLNIILMLVILIGWALFYTFFFQGWSASGVWAFSSQVLLGAGVGVVVILLAAVVGIVAGWKIAPVLALAGALVILLRGMSSTASIFSIGGANGSLIGLVVPDVVQLAQLFGLAVFAAAAIWVVRREPSKSVNVMGAAVPLAAVLVGLTAPAFGTPKYVPSTMPVSKNCTVDPNTGQPFACVAEQHQRLVDPLTERFQDLHAAAREYGLERIPETITEYTFNQGQPEKGVLTWQPSKSELDIKDPHVSIASFVASVSQPAWCPALFSGTPPSEEYFNSVQSVQMALTTLLADESASPASKEAASDSFNKSWPSILACEGAE